MSSIQRKFRPERPLTRTEAAILARQMLDRARDAVRTNSAADGASLAQSKTKVRQLVRRARMVSLVFKIRNSLHYGSGFELGTIALLLAVVATGAALHR